jgi:acetolactate synthase-1/2/3 large subunit
MTTTIDPTVVVDAAVRAVGRDPQSAGLFAESSSAMFYVTRAVCASGLVPYVRFSTHYGSMGHALAGAIGFAAATGKRAVVVTGDGSMDLMNPLRVAMKHGLTLTIFVLNDSRLGLPFFGTAQAKAWDAHATTHLAPWDFTRQGSPLISGRRVCDVVELDAAITEAFAADNSCYVIDAQIDSRVVPPVDSRLDGVDAMYEAEDAIRRSAPTPDLHKRRAGQR